MLEELKKAALHIQKKEEKIKNSAEKLKEKNPDSREFIEGKMILPVSPSSSLDLKVGAVDGGILSYEMHGVDVLIFRSASAIFEYKNSSLVSSIYSPSSFPKPSYEIMMGLDEKEILWHKSLVRLDSEIKEAISAIKKYSPDFFFLDGSILPLPADKPSESSILFEKYIELISKYKNLYSIAKEKNIQLLGLIKDSRARRFVEFFPSHIPFRTSDTFFLNYLLKEGERTSSIYYSKEASKHQTLRDLKNFADDIRVFYLKPVQGDRPLRIEYLNSSLTVDDIASTVHSLSAINSSYAYPSVLIEADLRAAMDPEELEVAKKSLSINLPFVFQLKRNTRPFR